jgi:23S rRNA (pseudouridine1915-N3)-methyltransferase
VRLTFLAVGRLREAWVREGTDEYLRRLRAKLPTEIIEVKEGDDLTARLPARHRTWALDERGTQLSSEELARRLGRLMNEGVAGVTFVLGGADGLPRELLERADFTWSLGRLTLPHRLARLVAVEQVYRALSILANEPYHRA